jgi:glycosyltransferase involved in cell wall biosynthesis
MSAELAVVIPAYNEGTRLTGTLPRVLEYLNSVEVKSELLVVDDGSTDDTASLAEAAVAQSGRVKASVISYQPNRGKGYAVRRGLLEVSAEIALFSDADLSTPITEVPKLVDPIAGGDCDLAFGSRALDRTLIGVHQPWRREQGGRIFNLIVRIATGLPFWDTQCGFKAFHMSVCRPLIEAARIDRFGFDVELIYLAHLAGLRLCEVPVRWDHNTGGVLEASGNYTRDSLRMINEVRQIRADARRGVYQSAIEAARAAAKEVKTESGSDRVLTQSSSG